MNHEIVRAHFRVNTRVTLRYDYWIGNNPAGTEATVTKTRKDKRCKTGLRVFVRIPNVENPVDLDAGWFNECPLPQ